MRGRAGSVAEANGARRRSVDCDTALVLPDGDGLQVARAVREAGGQRYVPVIVISGDVQSHLEDRRFTEDVTDYFDKGLGHNALAAFIRGYVQPEPIPDAHVLYIEDSRTVAVAIRRMLESHQMRVTHVTNAEDAIAYLEAYVGTEAAPGADLVLTDLYLKGELDGRDVLDRIRNAMGYGKRRLPVLVMTGDDNRDNQAALLRGRQRPGACRSRSAYRDQGAVPAAARGCRTTPCSRHERRLLEPRGRRAWAWVVRARGHARAVGVPARAQGRGRAGLSAGARSSPRSTPPRSTR